MHQSCDPKLIIFFDVSNVICIAQEYTNKKCKKHIGEPLIMR
jgi:hypothetical protein